MENESNESQNFNVNESNVQNNDSLFSDREHSFQTQDSSAQEVPTPYEASAPAFSVPHFDRINSSSPTISSITKVTLGVVVVLIIIGVGSIFAFSGQKNSSNTSPQISTTQTLRSSTRTTLQTTTVSTTVESLPTTVQSTVAVQTTVAPTTSTPQTTQPPPSTTTYILGPPVTGPPLNSYAIDKVTINASAGTITTEQSSLPDSLAYVTVTVINASTANFTINSTPYHATPSLRVTLSSRGSYIFEYGNSSTTIELTG